MRQRRYHKCRKLFEPEKHFYFYYSGDCRVADVGPHYKHDYRGYQRERATHYDHGWNDAWRSRPPPPLKGLAMDDLSVTKICGTL
jgi:hypothetical protein